MNLQSYQQKLAGLIQGTYSVGLSDDSHLTSIAESLNLQVTQEVIIEWRKLSIEHYCQLTSSALKQLGLFHKEVHRFVTQHGFSPYVEELGQAFLAALETHEVELIARLAEFERALIDVQQGTREKVTVRWRHDPYAVLAAIMEGRDLITLQSVGEYETHIAKNIPGMFKVIAKNAQ
jgi:hypothetical protein